MKFCMLTKVSAERAGGYLKCTYPHFVPDVVITLEHGEVMLYGYDETVTIHQLFGQIAG